MSGIRTQCVEAVSSVRLALRAVVLCCALFVLPVLLPAPAHASVAGLEDGTYVLDDITSTTGMTSLDPVDAPTVLVVEGDTAHIVMSLYNADKFDAIWKGKRSEAPEDPATAPGLIEGKLIEADEAYRENGMWRSKIYTDPFGVSYKALEFAIPVTADDLATGRLYFVLRRSPWSPSNQGKWMGTADNYFSFSTSFIPDVESHLARARRLISDLPADTYQITINDAGRVAEAMEAYEICSPEEQALLDSEACGMSSQSYGRVLEAAQWRIASFAEIDNATVLADGVYTGKATASSDMGKSTSARARTWSIDKLTVKDGRVNALITWSGSTPLGSLQLGGKIYDNVGSGSTSSFEIPIDLNTDMYFAVKSRVATEDSVAITYHLFSSIDEATAVPDDPGKEGGDDPGKGDDPGEGGGKDPDGNKDSDGKKDPGGNKDQDGKKDPGGNKDPDGKKDPADKNDSDGDNNGSGGNNNSGENNNSGGNNANGSDDINNSGTSGTTSGTTNGTTLATPVSTNGASSASTGTTSNTTPAGTASETSGKTKTSAKGDASTAKSSMGINEADGNTPLASSSGTAQATDPTAAYAAALVLILSLIAGAIAFVYQYRRAEKGWR